MTIASGVVSPLSNEADSRRAGRQSRDRRRQHAGGGMTDQRGFPRVGGTRADIGAYEREPGAVFTRGFE